MYKIKNKKDKLKTKFTQNKTNKTLLGQENLKYKYLSRNLHVQVYGLQLDDRAQNPPNLIHFLRKKLSIGNDLITITFFIKSEL